MGNLKQIFEMSPSMANHCLVVVKIIIIKKNNSVHLNHCSINNIVLHCLNFLKKHMPVIPQKIIIIIIIIVL